MDSKQVLRQLLEKAATTYEFRDGYTTDEISKHIDNSYYGFKNYVCKTDEDKEIAKQLYGIIHKINKKEKLDLKPYSNNTLYRMATLMNKENDNGCYTYDEGVFWYGYKYFKKASEMIEAIRQKQMTPQQKLVEDIKSSKLLDKLKSDFPDIRLLDKETYKEYLDYEYRNYSGLGFAQLGKYMLEFVGIGYLESTCIVNASVRHIKITDHIGFRVRNTQKGNILKIESYADIKQVLKRAG